MGGIGKTELALQYAISSFNQQLYPGGVYWLQARDQEIATQIISFAKANLGIKPPDELKTDEQVTFIWQRWPAGDSLIILDDVTDYAAIFPYLPPPSQKFKILITTRINLGSTVTQIEIEQLSNQAAIALLKSIVGSDRIESQLAFAEALCHKVGNLPLGLELLGRFLAKKKDWTIQKLAERLESNKLETKALKTTELGMTAELGVAKALELSWIELTEAQQELACLLGMFAVAPIPWPLVERCLSEQDKDDLEDIRDEGLIANSLLKRVGQGTYQLHQIVQQFFLGKLKESSSNLHSLQEDFCKEMVGVAQSIKENPTIDVIEKARATIPHLEEVINHWISYLKDEDLLWPFDGICRFYKGQGNYSLALPVREKCLEETRQRLGSIHPYVASSLHNLAYLYDSQARYSEAEPLYIQALEMRQKLFSNEHPDIVRGLSELANLYRNQGQFEEACPYYEEALEMSKKLFGNEHPYVASSLHNLAGFYDMQGQYKKAEAHNIKALEMYQKLMGTEHPTVATSLHNLANLYNNQGRYTEAEPLYLQAVKMYQKFFGAEHLFVASIFNDLAALFKNQGRYEEAEPLYLQTLEIRQKFLSFEHPDVLYSLRKLALLYDNQGRYEEAEPLYVQILEMRQRLLGDENPDVAQSLNNLALIYDIQSRYWRAEPLYLQALEMRQKLLGTEHLDVGHSMWCLGGLYQRLGRNEDAEGLYRKALVIYEEKLGSSHPHTESLRNFLASLS